MAVLSTYILLIIFESSKLLSSAATTYCTIPCPFMCPAQTPANYGAIQLPPRKPVARSTFYDSYTDYEEIPESRPSPPLAPIVRPQKQPDPDPPSPPPRPKPKPKPPPVEEEQPLPKRRNPSLSSPSSPCIQPSRRFFTSLCSIPGAIMDTLIGGEITL